MSQEGYDKLVAELRQLESVELPQVRDAIAEARDKGDLSENFEYHAAKRISSTMPPSASRVACSVASVLCSAFWRMPVCSTPLISLPTVLVCSARSR